MSRFEKLTSIARSAVVALAIGGAAIAVAPPAQAASATIDLHFGYGGGGIHIGGGKYCLSDRQVRYLLRAYGYRDIRFTDRQGRVVEVKAERYHHRYRIAVDTCRARIVDIHRIKNW